MPTGCRVRAFDLLALVCLGLSVVVVGWVVGVTANPRGWYNPLPPAATNFVQAAPVAIASATIASTRDSTPEPVTPTTIPSGAVSTPTTEIAGRLRSSVITYTVQPGDTVPGIAMMFGIRPETIIWSNPELEEAPDNLRIGQELVILPIDGVYHTVVRGDTLASIASKYKAKVEDITEVPFNNLKSLNYVIEPGMKLIVAGGEKPSVPKVVTAYVGSVPSATDTPTPTVTVVPAPLPTVTLAPTPVPSPTRSVFTYTAVITLQVHPVQVCDWMGVAGSVVDLQGKPALGAFVRVWGLGNVDQVVAVGANPVYGSSGWEVRLARSQIVGNWNVQLVASSDAKIPLSDVYTISMPGDCKRNLALVRFQQNH